MVFFLSAGLGLGHKDFGGYGGCLRSNWVLGMGYVILLWHSLSLPYNYLTDSEDGECGFCGHEGPECQ